MLTVQVPLLSDLSELPPLPYDEQGETQTDLGEQLSVDDVLNEDERTE